MSQENILDDEQESAKRRQVEIPQTEEHTECCDPHAHSFTSLLMEWVWVWGATV